jgi:hypothetical protein
MLHNPSRVMGEGMAEVNNLQINLTDRLSAVEYFPSHENMCENASSFSSA